MGERFDPNSAEYEVGYGKPPEHTQWQPRQSGNPQGRPPRPPINMAEIAPSFAEAFLRTINAPFRIKTVDGIEERDLGDMVATAYRRIIAQGKPREQIAAMESLVKTFNFIQVDTFRETALRGADQRIAEIQRLARMDALLEFFSEREKPRPDKDWIEHRDQIDRMLAERARMRREGMSDEQIYAAEEADDDDDHLSLDGINQDESDDSPVAPPQIKIVEPKPVGPTDQPGEDQHRDAPGHDPDPPPRR